MTEGEKAILAEIRSLRDHVDRTVARAHRRIDETNKEVSKTKDMALVNKTKLGSFIAGISFAFTGLGTFLAHWVKAKFMS